MVVDVERVEADMIVRRAQPPPTAHARVGVLICSRRLGKVRGHADARVARAISVIRRKAVCACRYFLFAQQENLVACVVAGVLVVAKVPHGCVRGGVCGALAVVNCGCQYR